MKAITEREFSELTLGEMEEMLSQDITKKEKDQISIWFSNINLSDNDFIEKVYDLYLNVGKRCGKVI